MKDIFDKELERTLDNPDNLILSDDLLDIMDDTLLHHNQEVNFVVKILVGENEHTGELISYAHTSKKIELEFSLKPDISLYFFDPAIIYDVKIIETIGDKEVIAFEDEEWEIKVKLAGSTHTVFLTSSLDI